MKKNSLATRRRRERLLSQGLCTKCGKEPHVPDKTKCDACLRYFVEYNRAHASKIKPRERAYREKLRAEVIEKYGGLCDCCGEKRLKFLAIDHKNRDGNVERKKLFGKNNSGGSYSWYLRLKREPRRDDLRVLCHNCNIAIAFYGTCPHEEEREKMLIHNEVESKDVLFRELTLGSVFEFNGELFIKALAEHGGKALSLQSWTVRHFDSATVRHYPKATLSLGGNVKHNVMAGNVG